MRGYRYERLPIEHVPGKPLGRHINHDPRSRRYAVPVRAEIQDVLHQRQIAVFNQGFLGSCTGNAAVGAIATHPFKLDRRYLYDQPMCVEVYSAATKIDPFAGSYPPEDTGSDGLSVAKIIKNMGLCSGYQHAFSLQAALSALQDYPVITGVTWYDSFDRPRDTDGLIEITPGAQSRGGHEFVVVGVEVEPRTVICVNSWGPHWGPLDGVFRMSWDTWGTLLDDRGDVTVMIPPGEPAPEPQPAEPGAGCMPFSKTIDRMRKHFRRA